MTFDSEPYIDKGTTRVPMRAIFEGLGAVVDFDGETKTVVINYTDDKVKVKGQEIDKVSAVTLEGGVK